MAADECGCKIPELEICENNLKSIHDYIEKNPNIMIAFINRQHKEVIFSRSWWKNNCNCKSTCNCEHNCSCQCNCKWDGKNIIYVDLTRWTSLMDLGEWDFYLNQVGIETTDIVFDKIKDGLPKGDMYTLP